MRAIAPSVSSSEEMFRCLRPGAIDLSLQETAPSTNTVAKRAGINSLSEPRILVVSQFENLPPSLDAFPDIWPLAIRIGLTRYGHKDEVDVL